MATSVSAADPLATLRTPLPGWLALLRSPWLWGGAATWGLYAAIPYTGAWAPFWQRYLAGHPVEYAEVGLFLVGVAILLLKVWQLSVERQAAAWTVLALAPPVDLPSTTRKIHERLTEIPRRLHRTFAVQRLVDLADYLRDRRDADGVEPHAQLLSQQALDRQHDDYGQLQTLIWAVPILGFLGTVMGITLSIANLTPEQLDSSLNSVTGGLAVAFDTTAVALIQSIVLVFGAYFVKRSESQLLAQVDEQVFKGLVSPLSAAARSSHPLVEAEAQAARALLERTESLINRQTDLWRESVDGLRERWSHTVAAQQSELTTALSGGVQSALGDHTQLLAAAREAFLSTCRAFTTEAETQLADARSQHAAHQQQLSDAWRSAWTEIQQELARERTDRAAESRQLLDGFAAHVQSTVEQLAALTTALQSQCHAVSRQSELLAEIVGQEHHLAGLQSRLTENLQALGAAETIQQSVHSLTAAIHLLTARARAAA